MLVVAYHDTLRLAWLRGLHCVSGLASFGIAGAQKYVYVTTVSLQPLHRTARVCQVLNTVNNRFGGYYVLHLLLWECATPFRSARWLGRALQTDETRVDRHAHDSDGGALLWVWAALLELFAYSAVAVTLGPSLADAAVQDFPAALTSALDDSLGTAEMGAPARLAPVILLAGLCVQLVCLAIYACMCVAELCRACSQIGSKQLKKSD